MACDEVDEKCEVVEMLTLIPSRLGKEKYDDLMETRGVGVVVKSYTIDLKRPVAFPDSVCRRMMTGYMGND